MPGHLRADQNRFVHGVEQWVGDLAAYAVEEWFRGRTVPLSELTEKDLREIQTVARGYGFSFHPLTVM